MYSLYNKNIKAIIRERMLMIWAQGEGGSQLGSGPSLTNDSDHTESRAGPGTVFLVVRVYVCSYAHVHVCTCVSMHMQVYRRVVCVHM